MTPTAAGLSLVEFFPRVRIINLEHRRDRRTEMTDELARIGIAVDGTHVAFHKASSFSEPGGFRTNGARGCFHSHLAILREAAAAATAVLILEDDADLARDIDNRLPPALDYLRTKNWSIFYGFAGSPTEYAAKLSLADPEKNIALTHCVGFSAHAVQCLVPYLDAMLARPPGSPEGGAMDVDGAYSWFRRAYPDAETWCAYPDLATQRPSRTDVTPGLLDQLPGTRQALTLWRKLKRRVSPRR